MPFSVARFVVPAIWQSLFTLLPGLVSASAPLMTATVMRLPSTALTL